MAPRTPKASEDRPYGLSNTEINVVLHACKLLIVEGKVDNEKLAKLTGHARTKTAYNYWNIAKNKILAGAGGGDLTPAQSADTDSPGAAAVSPVTPTTAGKKRGRFSKEDPVPPAVECEVGENIEGEDPSPSKRPKMEEMLEAPDEEEGLSCPK